MTGEPDKGFTSVNICLGSDHDFHLRHYEGNDGKYWVSIEINHATIFAEAGKILELLDFMEEAKTCLEEAEEQNPKHPHEVKIECHDRKNGKLVSRKTFAGDRRLHSELYEEK